MVVRINLMLWFEFISSKNAGPMILWTLTAQQTLTLWSDKAVL